MFVCAVQPQGQMVTGPLVVVNSSMVTMEEFRFLASIGSSSSHTHVNGNAYALVIDGLMCARFIGKVYNTFAGNGRLTDVGHVLDLQIDAAGGTYVANNERLCFEASTAWAQRNDSLLKYSLSAVCACIVCMMLAHCCAVYNGALHAVLCE